MLDDVLLNRGSEAWGKFLISFGRFLENINVDALLTLLSIICTAFLGLMIWKQNKEFHLEKSVNEERQIRYLAYEDRKFVFMAASKALREAKSYKNHCTYSLGTIFNFTGEGKELIDIIKEISKAIDISILLFSNTNITQDLEDIEKCYRKFFEHCCRYYISTNLEAIEPSDTMSLEDEIDAVNEIKEKMKQVLAKKNLLDNIRSEVDVKE
ncbi:MAG: hypothetical protein ACK5L6_00325 [Anaerorhabdus sp.]|uniref:hypothetical protein n=1 Tax=Anaerorhabdus sp. TaxID=1872524 RepID=UPI003A8942A2